MHRAWYSAAVPELYADAPPTYDAFLELWWPDVDSMARGLAQQDAWGAVRAPEDTDEAASSAFAASEHVVVPVRDA